ncbi:hypothetical protein C5Y93_15760 [Blastopirellula marina]|uniref:Uncharacterized protein n=1 Tax=Blastopirellula marina TaxID=124 RepID=A0A2S8GKL1_9BACT|nr:hypothetical protein C5Y93_15760 [Blastopirellula marina]
MDFAPERIRISGQETARRPASGYGDALFRVEQLFQLFQLFFPLRFNFGERTRLFQNDGDGAARKADDQVSLLVRFVFADFASWIVCLC